MISFARSVSILQVILRWWSNRLIFSKLKDKRVKAAILAIEILISFVLFYTLSGGMGVEFDEGFTWNIVVYNSFRGICAATAADVHPPLYYLIIKVAFLLFGQSIKVLTWVSIVPVLLGMILSSVFISKRWGFGTALIFNLAYGFAPFILHYNMNLRMYSWMEFFVLGTVLICYEIYLEHKTSYYILLFIFSILAVYTQYFALLPIAFSYLWLFICILRSRGFKKCIPFIVVCVLDVVCYLPWLLYGMGNMGVGGGGKPESYKFFFDLNEIFTTLFRSNLENCVIMSVILIILAVVLFVAFHKRYSGGEKSFIIMLTCNVFFCWIVAQFVGKLNGHHFEMRYVIYCLMFVWLILSIVYTRCNLFVSVVFLLWVMEFGLSSYLIERSYEYDTTVKMPYTMEFIEANVESDAVIVYNYDPGFWMAFDYYMPGHEFIYIDDLDFETIDTDEFWMLNHDAVPFPDETVEEYGLEIEMYPGMGFMEPETFDMWKVKVNR